MITDPPPTRMGAQFICETDRVRDKLQLALFLSDITWPIFIVHNISANTEMLSVYNNSLSSDMEKRYEHGNNVCVKL